jgi:hypothetical protein
MAKFELHSLGGIRSVLADVAVALEAAALAAKELDVVHVGAAAPHES